ncbi:TKL family protein kinase [Tritrichomonas foetus]|uniref:TKL family protein kinase n=1 Tax=Tritrichomonas foetus TaxID=1144522 RepID=A0A1J4JAI7_9EUKA|nr:TKL family protein kinase [Tritrichomonas foetus]|eukprot:OHS96186.1 TKL family protein kinase [Tritrichomonas foetus]
MIAEFNPLDTILQQLEDLESDFPDLVVKKSQFSMGSVIGKGGFGEVYRAKDRKSQKECAYKQIFSEKLEGHRMRRYIAEIKTMASCYNMFLVPLVGFTAEAPYSIVTEYMPRGSLDKYIRKRHANDVCPLSGTQLTSIAIGIAHGMIHLHQKGIIHRDLKAANILLDNRYFPKICDFGIARFEDIGGGMTQKIGTPNYMAPELIVSNAYDNKVDVYAFGMILFEMSEGVRPFKGMKLMEIFSSVVKNQQRPEFSNATPESLQKLISKCWAQDPKERPPFEEIFEILSKGIAAFPDTKLREIRRFCKLIRRDEEKRGPIREQHERELKERQLARQKGQKVDPRKKTEDIEFSDYYEEDEYDRPIVVDNNILSPIGEKAPNRQSSRSSKFDIKNLSDPDSPTFEKDLNHYANSLQPKQVSSFIQLLIPHLKSANNNSSNNKGTSVSSLRAIVHVVTRLMNRNKNFIIEILKTQFVTLLPVYDDRLIDECIEFYRILFEKHQDRLTDEHIPYVTEMLQKRPSTMLCMFSSYVTACSGVENYYVDLLFDLPRIVKDTPDGKLLLTILDYMMATNPKYAKINMNRVLDIFYSFLKSNDPGTAVLAMRGLIRFKAKINEKDIPYLTKYLHNNVLWSHTLRYLGESQFILSSDELVRALVYRASHSKLAALILLRIASSPSEAPTLLKYPQWMVISEEHQKEAFQIFCVLFLNKNNRRTLTVSEQFPYFLKNIARTGEDVYIGVIPSIIKRATINSRTIKDLTQSGFLATFLEEVTKKNDTASYKFLLIVTDKLARTGYSDEFLRIANTLMTVMNNASLFPKCISVFIVLSQHQKCVQMFLNSGVLQYLEQYKQNSHHATDVTKFIEKVKSHKFADK